MICVGTVVSPSNVPPSRLKKTAASAHALAAACYNASAFLKDKELMRTAYVLWDKLSEKYPEYAKYRDMAEELSR